MTLFPKLSNFRISPRPRRGLSRFGYLIGSRWRSITRKQNCGNVESSKWRKRRT
jgi:hypothetical protein